MDKNTQQTQVRTAMQTAGGDDRDAAEPRIDRSPVRPITLRDVDFGTPLRRPRDPDSRVVSPMPAPASADDTVTLTVDGQQKTVTTWEPERELAFSIANARFVQGQLLAGLRLAGDVRAVAPQIDGKLLYLKLRDGTGLHMPVPDGWTVVRSPATS